MDGFPSPYYRRSDRRRAPWRVGRDQWGTGEAEPSIESGGGARIDYTVHGDGRSSSSVVLLAGFTAPPATSWRYQIPSLIQSGHRVIAVDLPGHGTAPAMLPGTTMQTRAVVHAFIEQLDLQGAAMIGGSMGGSTIWSYVDTYGTGRLRAAVVVDQTPRMLNAPEWAYGFYGYDQEKVDTFFADGIPATGHGTPPIWKRGMRLVRLLAAIGRVDRTLSPPELALLNDHAKRDWRSTLGASDLPCSSLPVPTASLGRQHTPQRPQHSHRMDRRPSSRAQATRRTWNDPPIRSTAVAEFLDSTS